MRYSLMFCVLVMLGAGAAGCTSSPLPPVKQIAEIRLTIMRMPDDKAELAAPRIANLKERADIVEVMDWLHTIDWSQPGTDIAAIKIAQADGNILLINKSGAVHNYRFYWDGKFVHTLTNRLIRASDTDKWKEIVQWHCK